MPTVERRLIALLNLMTSRNDGERSNATDAACRYITSHKITWIELTALAHKLRDRSVLDAIYQHLFKRAYDTASDKSSTSKTCPVCGTTFEPAHGQSHTSPDGTSYGRPRVFCSDACKMKAYRARRKTTKKG
jgi:hypothetical protein